MLGKRITIIIILALQALSWSTSVAGAEIILPELNLVEWPITIRASLLLGTIIQGLLLFLFFFGRQEIQSSFYRRSLLILLTVASIYTSFFIIYSSLVDIRKNSEEIKLYNSVTKAVNSSKIYQEKTSILKKRNNLINDRDKRKREEVTPPNNPNAPKLPRGEDPEYKKQTREIEKINEENTDLAQIEKIKKSLPDDQDDKKIENVDKNKAIEPLSLLTDEIRKQVYESVTGKKVSENYSTTKLNDEILKKLKQDLEYSEFGYFLIPVEKVFNRNPEAIVALCIASFIDIISLIFGVSLDRKATDGNIKAKLKNLSRLIKELLKNFLPNLVKEIGHTLYIFIASIGSLINGIFKGFILLRVRALQVFYYTPYTIRIKGERHEFLHNIWESIEFTWEENNEFNLLNYTKLMTLAQYNQSYKVGYRKIIVTMRNLKWLTTIPEGNSPEDKKLTIKEYKKLDEWYHSEYSKQLGPEKNSMLDADDYHHIIRLPQDKGEGFGRFMGWIGKQFKKLIFAIRQIFTG
jgi:hypothetical protein